MRYSPKMSELYFFRASANAVLDFLATPNCAARGNWSRASRDEMVVPECRCQLLLLEIKILVNFKF